MDNERAHARQKEKSEPAGDGKRAAQATGASRRPFRHSPQVSSAPAPGSSAAVPLTRGNVLLLHNTIGNRAVGRFLQMKSKLSRPGDPSEQEADRVAEHVLRTPEPSPSPTHSSGARKNDLQTRRPASRRDGSVRRQALDEEAERGGQEEVPLVQMKLIGGADYAQRQTAAEEEKPRTRHVMTLQAKSRGGQVRDLTPEVESHVNSLRSGGGEPLPEPVRTRFEPRFGQDFSGVRIHRDQQAADSARALNARAYTIGQDIIFGSGEYAPGTSDGAHLLAHELTHVVQQQSAVAAPGLLQRAPDGGDEKEQLVYPVKVPKDVKTQEELNRYAEVLIFGMVINGQWVGDKLDVPALAKVGATVNYEYPASLVATRGGKKPGEALRPKASNPDYDKTKGKEREDIVKEIDARFRQKVGGGKDEKVQQGDQSKADMWNVYRDQVMAEKKQLEQLPAPLKELLLGGAKHYKPEEYQRLLKIGEKLKKFTSQDIAIFKMAAVPSDNLDAFEKCVDLFLARKEELQKALDAQKAQGQTKGKDTQQTGQGPQSMQEAIEGAWKGFDSSQIGKKSEADQYDLARQQAWKVTKAQLKYMKDHPGETALDFGKSALLMNTNETFDAIGKDLAEAANGDANAWARVAAGAGAGAKLSGWMLAVGAILYALSWLTGAGELATILGFMTAMLVSTIVLSTTESELRLKAASQAKDAGEFQTQSTKSGLTMTTTFVMVGMLVFSLAARFVAKTVFPATLSKIKGALAKLRQNASFFFGRLEELKAAFEPEINGYRQQLIEAGEAAKKSATQQADAVDKMSLDEFANKLESGSGDLFQEAAVRQGQKIPWKALSKTPAGLKAIQSLKAQLADGLRNAVPKDIDAMVKEQVDAVDNLLARVKSATTVDELNEATKDYDKFMSDEEVAKRGKAREAQMRSEKTDEALKQVEQELKQHELSAAKAKELIAKAGAERQPVTKDLTDVANANGLKMEGLDKAVKGEESLTRKINDRVKPEDVTNLGLEKAVEISAGKMNDVLRFTMILDVETYVAMINVVKAALQAKGYKFVRLWNGWTKSGGTYMGVNATFKTPKGMEIELQFHTKDSFRIKTQTHDVYEQTRSKVIADAEKNRLDQQQRDAYKGIEVPKDIEKVR